MDEPVGIVGASVAGLALACALAAQGVRCAVFEQGEGERERPGPAVLGARSLEALARWGGAGPVRAAGLSLRRIRIRYGGETLGYLPTAEIPSRHPVLACLEHGALRRTLADQARRSGLVDLRPPGRVVGVQGREGRVRILLEGGRTATFRFLAATCPDLRRLLGIALLGNLPALPRWSGQGKSGPAADEYELYLGPSGMVWTYPRIGGGVSLAAEAWRAETDAGALGRELCLPGQFLLEREAEVAESGFAATLRVGPVVLLGGAARTVPPGAWRSRDLDVAEAEALAWRLAALLRGAADDLLVGYELERRPRSLALAALGPGWLPRLCSPRAVRVLGPLLRASFVRRGLGEALSGISASYPPSSWCLDERPGRRRPGPRPGARLPEVRYLDGAGQRRWLLDLVGPRPLVLRFGDGASRPGGYRVSASRSGEGFLHDPEGSLGRALRGRAGEVMVVRPDGVVGYRAWPEDARRTRAWLARLGPEVP